jgi:hypothetical protein
MTMIQRSIVEVLRGLRTTPHHHRFHSGRRGSSRARRYSFNSLKPKATDTKSCANNRE